MKIADATLGLPPEGFFSSYTTEFDRNYSNSPHGSALSSPIHQPNIMYNPYSSGGIFGSSGQNSPVFGGYGYSSSVPLAQQPTNVSSITQGNFFCS